MSAFVGPRSPAARTSILALQQRRDGSDRRPTGKALKSRSEKRVCRRQLPKVAERG